MLLIRKLDNRSYQGHWSAWRLCLLKKSSTRGVKTLIWLGDRFHPFFSFQSSLMLLWNKVIRYIWSWFCLWKCYYNTKHSHVNGDSRSVVFHRTTWKGCIELCGRCIGGVWESGNHLLPWNSIYLCSWQVPIPIVMEEVPELHLQTWPIAATNRKVNLSNRWDFPNPRIL